MSDQPMTRAEMRERRQASRPPKRRWGPGRIAKYLAIIAVALGALGIAGVAIAYAMTDIPKPNEAAVAQASTIYYSDGKTVMDRIATVNRESVPLDKIPDHVQKAFLAAEDRDFYDNSGISPRGIARAVWVGVRGGEQQGGSTITQQYVKNYFLTQDRTLSRKAKEILISIKVDRERSKDEILESYLNTIYFGRGADGIQTASRAYFGKDVSKLSVSEGALLASVIRGPSLYDPRLGKEQTQLAKSRWQYTMDGLLSKGWITQEQYDKATFPTTKKKSAKRGPSGPTGFIVEEVRKQLHDKIKLSDADIDRGGFKIVTTIDKDQQDAAAKAVESNMPTGEGTKNLHAGLVSIEPGDGAIRAMYGGPDIDPDRQLGSTNIATQAPMQAGSTFKPFTLIAALQEGIPLWKTYDASSPKIIPEFKGPGNPTGEIENFANHQYGTIDLTKATAYSANTVYGPLNVEVGPAKTTEAAKTAGVTTKLEVNAANVFGTDSVKVVDMANAYATIAAEGKRATPYLISSIKGSGTFNLDYTAEPQTKQVFAKDVMRDTIKAMSAVIGPGGTGAHALELGRPAAGKTGTTTDNYSAWFDGFTPGQLATAVGVFKGNGELKPENQMSNVPGVGELTGGTVPLFIWTDFMEAALAGKPVAEMPPPGNIGGDYTPTPTATSTPPPSTTSSSSTSSSTTSSSTSTSTSTSTTKTHGTGKPTSTSTTSSTTSTSSTSSSTTSKCPPGNCTSSSTSTSPAPTTP